MDIFDKAICALYRQGFSILEIAYLLDIPIEEVKFAVYYYLWEYEEWF